MTRRLAPIRSPDGSTPKLLACHYTNYDAFFCWKSMTEVFVREAYADDAVRPTLDELNAILRRTIPLIPIALRERVALIYMQVSLAYHQAIEDFRIAQFFPIHHPEQVHGH